MGISAVCDKYKAKESRCKERKKKKLSKGERKKRRKGEGEVGGEKMEIRDDEETEKVDDNLDEEEGKMREERIARDAEEMTGFKMQIEDESESKGDTSRLIL